MNTQLPPWNSPLVVHGLSFIFGVWAVAQIPLCLIRRRIEQRRRERYSFPSLKTDHSLRHQWTDLIREENETLEGGEEDGFEKKGEEGSFDKMGEEDSFDEKGEEDSVDKKGEEDSWGEEASFHGYTDEGFHLHFCGRGKYAGRCRPDCYKYESPEEEEESSEEEEERPAGMRYNAGYGVGGSFDEDEEEEESAVGGGSDNDHDDDEGEETPAEGGLVEGASSDDDDEEEDDAAEGDLVEGAASDDDDDEVEDDAAEEDLVEGGASDDDDDEEEDDDAADVEDGQQSTVDDGGLRRPSRKSISEPSDDHPWFKNYRNERIYHPAFTGHTYKRVGKSDSY